MRSLLSHHRLVTVTILFATLFTGCSAGIQSHSSQNAPTALHGSNGLNIYWSAPSIGSTNSLGTVSFPVSGQGMTQILSPVISGAGGPMVCTVTAWNSAETALTITYNMAATTVHVTINVVKTDAGIEVQIDADQPVVASVDFGSWTSNLNMQAITIPYYTGNVWYVPGLSAYINGWWDWHSSQATKLIGTSAQYWTKTDGTRNKLHELMRVVVSPNIDEVLPDPGNQASPYMRKLAGRMVLDIWDSGFSSMQKELSDLGDYGIGNCVGIIHNWQHEGYDNALPEHYPANPDLGGGFRLKAAIEQGKDNGCLMAVHENYVDYYPNFPQFNSASVALNSDGSRMLAWLNSATGIQSFAAKSNWMVANAQAQSPVIHASYGTTAAYIDVSSALMPDQYVDMDAKSPQAGMISPYFQNARALWNFERLAHDGPVFGEGVNHWFYSGLLDGVNASLGAGISPNHLGEAQPLFVDFDLIKIHPLQINYGMGSYDAWASRQTSNMTTLQTDAYRMQEIAFGHGPFLSTGAWDDISRAFVESNLVTPIAASYGTAKVASIQYQVSDRWANSSVAAQSSQFNRVQVNYNNGLTLVANGSTKPLSWEHLTIPPYGWAAKSKDLLAYTAQCGSTICDYAQTATSIFANSRNQSDARIGWGYAEPSVTGVKQRADNSFDMNLAWKVYCAPGTQINYAVFVHFVEDSLVASSTQGIAFQGDHQPETGTSHWQVRQDITDGPVTVTIPPSVPDGTYSIRVGLFDPATGDRLLLSGNNDGTNRYIVGYLTLSNGGKQVGFTAPLPPTNDPRLNAAGTMVDFGTLKTDGMISITQEKGQWIMRPFPRYRNFIVLFNAEYFPAPSIVRAAGNPNTTVVPVLHDTYWQIPLNGSRYYAWPTE